MKWYVSTKKEEEEEEEVVQPPILGHFAPKLWFYSIFGTENISLNPYILKQNKISDYTVYIIPNIR